MKTEVKRRLYSSPYCRAGPLSLPQRLHDQRIRKDISSSSNQKQEVNNNNNRRWFWWLAIVILLGVHPKRHPNHCEGPIVAITCIRTVRWEKRKRLERPQQQGYPLNGLGIESIPVVVAQGIYRMEPWMLKRPLLNSSRNDGCWSHPYTKKTTTTSDAQQE